MIANSALNEFFPPNFVTGAVSGLPQKPDRLHIIRALETCCGKETMLLPENTIIIGDGKNDILAASEIQCKSVAVTYGFSTEQELLEYHPTKILNSFNEVTNQILQWVYIDKLQTNRAILPASH